MCRLPKDASPLTPGYYRTMPAREYRQHLEVETPEHVVLDLEIAGVGSRALAAILDMLILVGGMFGGVRRPQHPGRVRIQPRALGLGDPVARRLRGLDRVLHLLRGLAPGADARQAHRGDPGADGHGPRGHARRPPPCGICSAWPISFPRPTSSAPLLVAFHPRGKRLGDLVRRHDRGPGSPGRGTGRAAAAAGPGPSPGASRSSPTPSIGCSSSSSGVRPSCPPRPELGSRPSWWTGWRRPSRPGHPTRSTCSLLYQAERGRREGRLSRSRFAVREARPLGRVPAAGRPRLAPGARQLRVGGAARLRGPLSRGRRRPGPGPHLPRG